MKPQSAAVAGLALASLLHILFILIGCVPAGAAAGPGTASPWPKPLGGPDQEYAVGLAVDDLSHLITTGRFQGTAAFDATRLTSAGQTDVFVASLDAGARVAWAVSFGGPGADEGQGIAATPEGDVYVTGSFSGTVDFDPGPGRTELTSAGKPDAFLVHLSPKGELVWARRLGGKQGSVGLRVAATADAVWMAGSFQGTMDGTPGMVSAGKSDAFVARFSPGGDLLWARRIGGAKDDEARGVAAGRGGEVWVAGTFEETPSLGPESGGLDVASAGHKDVFLLRLDATGRLAWSGRLGGTNDDVCEGLAATIAGGAAVIGEFRETMDADPGPASLSLVSHGSTDAFLVRVDGNGRLVWAKGFGEEGADLGTAVAGDRFGSVYAAGYLARHHGQSFAWAAEYSDSGERAWSVALEASRGLQALAIAANAQGAAAVAGAFQGETKELREAGAGRVPGFGKNDAFVWRLVPPTAPARSRP